MMNANGVSLVKVAGMIVLMVEVYPTAFMMALDPAQARRLAEKILENADEEGADGELSLADLLKGAKPQGPQ